MKPNVESGPCAHYWMIDAPNGQTSIGICKKCGVDKTFTNSYDRIEFGQYNHKGQPKPRIESPAQAAWNARNQ